jgi:subtilisin family serine protease
MSDSTDYLGRLTAFTILALMLVPALAAAVPLPSEQPQDSLDVVDERTVLWWENTNMDLDQDRVHDAIWVAPYSTHYDYVDDAGRISVIVDFDHEPNAADEQMLEREVDFETQFRYWLIHSIAGRVDLDRIDDIVSLPGVVFVELDGRLEVLMNDVKPTHGVDLVWQDTGYTGAGITMAIIDTGIDGNHSGIDDLDDDNSTHDPKILGFYDAINNPDKTNGTEVEPYDDHGHGSHCAGITTGTGAPTYEYIGIAKVSSSQIDSLIIELIDSGATQEWVESYVNYIGALKKLNEKITETIVVANLMNDDDNSNSINEIIAKIHQLETESLDLIKKSDNTRP